jgi:hypothetical protein
MITAEGMTGAIEAYTTSWYQQKSAEATKGNAVATR